MRKPKPPPRVAPDNPTLPSVPVVTARSCCPSAVTASNWLSPAPTLAVRAAVSISDRLQLADIDHDAVVDVRPALKAVTAAAHPQRDVVLPRPREGVNHVLGLLGEDDDQRIANEQLVPAEARTRVIEVPGTDDAAGQLSRRALRAEGRPRAVVGRNALGAYGDNARDKDRPGANGRRRLEQFATRKVVHGRSLSIGLRQHSTKGTLTLHLAREPTVIPEASSDI